MTRNLAEWPQATWWRPSVRLAALLAPFLTAAVLSTARGSVTVATSVLILVVWVVGAAATGDRLAGVLAAVSTGAWFDFFLTEPYLRFTIADADDVEATVLLVVISLAVGELALWGYRQQKQAARRSGYLDGVLAAARVVADSCRYIEGPVRDARIAVLDHDGVLTRNGHVVDVERSGLPADEYVAVPVQRRPQIVGHFLLTATSHPAYPTREQRRVAVLLADQVAAVQ